MNKLTQEEFDRIYNFLHKRNIHPNSEIEAAYLALNELTKLDLSHSFSSHFDQIDERRVYSFLWVSVKLGYNRCKVVAVLNFSEDKVLAEYNSKNQFRNIVDCVSDVLKFYKL